MSKRVVKEICEKELYNFINKHIECVITPIKYKNEVLRMKDVKNKIVYSFRKIENKYLLITSYKKEK
ncbi:MAG: hypothetical protein ACI4D9_00525 [Lachnospiraceae bacterium]